MTSQRRLWDGRMLPEAPVLEHLRAVLVDSGYTAAALGELLPASRSAMGLLTFDPLVHGRRFDPDGPLAALVACFLFDTAVGEGRLRAVLGPSCLDALTACGLLVREGREVRACVELHPWEHLLVPCDPSAGGRHEAQVLGMTPAAATLAYLTVRREGGAALDLGTGCGIQALLAAGHSATTTATDVNPRAIAFAELNARLNGAGGIEARVGSWFAPVAGRRFDLVVSNPPYVISPDAQFTYRDAGLPGDEVCERVVRGAAAHLAEGGFATVLCNWVCAAGAGPADAPLRWVQDTGCDAVVLQFGADDPLTYAASFNGHLRDSDSAAFGDAVDRWLGYFRTLGAEAIGSGAVVLRRRGGGAAWAKLLGAPGGPTGWAGDHVARLFRAHDRLAAAGGPERLLEARLRPAGAHRIDHALAYDAAAGYTQAPAALRLEPGAGLEAELDPRLVGLLVRCDGSRRLRDLVAEAAGGQPDVEAAVARAGVDAFRRLLELGLLVEDDAPAPG